MNRRSFLKTIGGLSAAIALPTYAIAAILPDTYAVSAVRWTKAYDSRVNGWIFRGDCWIGEKIGETPTEISIENPIQLGFDVRSATEILNEESKAFALRVLKESAEHEVRRLNGVLWIN